MPVVQLILTYHILAVIVLIKPISKLSHIMETLLLIQAT